MSTLLHRGIWLAGLMLFGFCAAPSAMAAEPLSVIDAYGAAGVDSVAMAPDGKHIAAMVSAGGGNSIVMIDTADMSSTTIVQSKWVQDGFYRVKKDPWRVRWITSSWLSVDYPFSAEAIDLTGRKVADLGTRSIGRAAWLTPDSPLMLIFDDDKYQTLAVVNVKTRDKKTLRYPMSGRLLDWALDDEGQLRVVVLANSGFWEDKTTLSYWYLPLGSKEWKSLGERGLTEEQWEPLRASSTADEIIVASREGRDTVAIFSYDPIKRQLGEMLAGHPKEDIRVIDDVASSEYQSVVTYGMKPMRYWFDAHLAGLQAEVDKALPGRINGLAGDPHGLMLIRSYSDVDPGRWFLLDTGTMTLRLVLVAQPRIDPARMRPTQIMSYPAPDGLVIPAYLTLPERATGPQPMVVLVHGGPVARDEWQWDPEVQLLATRGYVVFQPQFRGSAGFGKAFQVAGYGQWGLAMQDDITAGVEHLIKQGVADPKRICIYGGSYGGYAAVWGLVKTPDLYRCGVTVSGVSDIEYMLSDRSDINSSKTGRELQRFMVGDRERDKAKFDQVSPLQHADRIKAPLLIAHGDDDARVPMSHAKKLMKALDAAHKTYQWHMADNEGHGFYYLRSQYKFSTELLQFLDKHIGSGTAPDKAQPESKP